MVKGNIMYERKHLNIHKVLLKRVYNIFYARYNENRNVVFIFVVSVIFSCWENYNKDMIDKMLEIITFIGLGNFLTLEIFPIHRTKFGRENIMNKI